MSARKCDSGNGYSEAHCAVWCQGNQGHSGVIPGVGLDHSDASTAAEKSIWRNQKSTIRTSWVWGSASGLPSPLILNSHGRR